MRLPELQVDLPGTSFQLDVQSLLRIVIIAGALAGSAYLARPPSLTHLALLTGIGGILVVVRWPGMGLVAVIVGGLSVPLSFGTGTETSINLSMLLIAALTGLWLIGMLVRGDFRLVVSPPIVPVLTFMIVSLLAFVAGIQSWLPFAAVASVPAQAGGLAIFLLSACAFLVVAHQMRDIRWLQWLTWTFLAVGAMHVAERLLSTAVQASLPRVVLLKADGGVFWVWLAALAFGQAAFNRNLLMPVRVALGALVAASFYFGLVHNRDWTSGWLPGLVAVGVTTVVGAPRLAPFVMAVGGALLASRVNKLLELVLQDESYSLMTRLEAWRILGEIIAINPVLGLGFANYYHYTPLFPILGYAVRFNSHNNYIDIVAQTGIVGLAIFGWFMLATAKLGWRLRLQKRTDFTGAYICSALGGLAGTLVAGMLGDWFLPFVYNVGLYGFRASVLSWIFLGGLVAIEQIAPTQSLSERKVNGFSI